VGPLVFQLKGDEEPGDDRMRALHRRNDRVRIFNISDAIN
jgi:hypothetical protein